MVYIVKETFYVKLYYILKSWLLHKPVGCRYRIFNRPIWTESIAIVAEPGFADRFHDLLDTLLYQSIPDTRDSQWPGIPVWFWDVFASYASWGVAVFSSLDDFAYPCCDFISGKFTNIRNLQLVCSRRKTPGIGFDVPIGQQDIFSWKYHIHQVLENFSCLTSGIQFIKGTLHIVVFSMAEILHAFGFWFLLIWHQASLSFTASDFFLSYSQS